MLYNLNGKNIKIPDKEIESNMRLLDLTKEEAIQVWLEDNEYLTNVEQEELIQKTKGYKIQHEAKTDKPKEKTKRERKPDEEKEDIIQKLAETVKNFGENVQITNKSKIIEFNIGENHYKIDLIRQRNK